MGPVVLWSIALLFLKLTNASPSTVPPANILTFTASQGAFNTPGYPGNYPPNSHFGWEIEATQSGADIAMVFHVFDLEAAQGCSRFDYVMLYKQLTDTSPWQTLGFADGYCGNPSSFPVSTKAKRVFVEFVSNSDSNSVFQGFNATYLISIIQGPPNITCLGKNGDCSRMVNTEQRETLTLSCQATSIPPPQFMWSFRNASNGSFSGIPTSIQKNIFSNGSIQLHNLDMHHTGTFKVYAYNSLGNMTGEIEMVVKEKCKCPKVVTTNWYGYEPYTPFMSNGVTKGIFYTILNKIIADCCGNCSGGHGPSSIDFGNIAANQQRTLADVKSDIESTDPNTNYDLSFPLSGGKKDDRYSLSYWFLPTVESPGVVFYVAGSADGSSAEAIFDSVIQGWPIFILTVVMTLLAGIIMWALDTKWNEEQFPRPFTEGVVEGFWWAFVTMTTVGYGDIAPVGVPGRCFAIMWILTGLVIVSIFTGVITTSLTVVALETDVPLYGTQVGAMRNTPEFRLGVIKNANVSTFTDYHVMANSLKSREILGVLIDAYVAAHQKSAFHSSKIRVNKILTSNNAFGFVLGKRLSDQNLYQCFADYIEQNKQQITADVEMNTDSIAEPTSSASEDTTAGLFDASSSLFVTTIVISAVLLVVFSIGGLVFEYGYLRPRHRMIEAAKQLEMVESEEVKMMARRAQQLKETLLHEVQEFFDRWNESLYHLTKKHKQEQKKMAERGNGGCDKSPQEEAIEMKKATPCDSMAALSATDG